MLKIIPAYRFNPISRKWEKAEEDKDIHPKEGWEINEVNILQSKFRAGNAPLAGPIFKFLVDYCDGKILLVEPYTNHSTALGETQGRQRAIDEFGNWIRAFYDAKENAVGFRTPYVDGLKENNWVWTDDLKAQAFEKQWQALQKIRDHNPAVKAVFDIGNNDVGKLEMLDWNSLPENSTGQSGAGSPEIAKAYFSLPDDIAKKITWNYMRKNKTRIVPSMEQIIAIYQRDYENKKE